MPRTDIALFSKPNEVKAAPVGSNDNPSSLDGRVSLESLDTNSTNRDEANEFISAITPNASCPDNGVGQQSFGSQFIPWLDSSEITSFRPSGCGEEESVNTSKVKFSGIKLQLISF